jgi:hypothetical protein
MMIEQGRELKLMKILTHESLALGHKIDDIFVRIVFLHPETPFHYCYFLDDQYLNYLYH